LNLESEILKLEEELQNHTYKPGKSICFVVEEPSLREVFAATFRDRVVHHLLYNFLEPIFEPKFINQSCACRKNKGIHYSLKYLKKYIRQVSRNHSQPAYFLHLDISGFFMSLNKEILFNIISKQIKEPEILWLIKVIIFNDPIKNFTGKGDKSLFDKIPPHKSLFHTPENQGLPIGNLTSQFFANVYLNQLDQFIKHSLKAKHYLRYVDDFLILSNDKISLQKWRNQIDKFLKERLQLKLNHQKTIFQNIDKGIDWLGYIVKPNYILVRRRVVKNFKRKIFYFNRILQNRYSPPIELIEKMLATVNSYYGHFKHADTFKLRKHLWENYFKELHNYIKPVNCRYNYFIIKNIGNFSEPASKKFVPFPKGERTHLM
jgi:retron-type reverse transcriptase